MELISRNMGKVKILELTGSFDRLNVEPVRQWIENAIASDPAFLVVNLNKVDFLDSSALAILVSGLKKARQQRGDLRICGLRQSVRLLFELTRLDKVFEIYLSEDDAVQGYAYIEATF